MSFDIELSTKRTCVLQLEHTLSFFSTDYLAKGEMVLFKRD